MAEKKFPDNEAYPLRTLINLYQCGFDNMSRQWNLTHSWKDKPLGSPEFETYVFWRMNLVIWTCCYIESIVNLEGVSWMGVEFYKDVVEHLRIRQKMRLIHALKYNKQLPSDEETLKKVQNLFDVRNRYVHPKTRDVKTNGNNDEHLTFQELIAYEPPMLDTLVKSVYSLIKDPPGNSAEAIPVKDGMA